MRFLLQLKRSIRENLFLSFIILMGFVLRFVSVNPGYYYPHGDELLYGQALFMIINKTLSFQPQYFGFPPLIPWLMIPFFTFLFIPGAWFLTLLGHIQEIYIFLVPFVFLVLLTCLVFRKRFNFLKSFVILFWLSLVASGIFVISKGTIFDRDILGKDWINGLYWGRYLTVVFGTGAIFLTYKTALGFFEKKRVALLSAIFCAVNYRLVLNSHVGLPDMYNVFWLMLSMYMITQLYKKPSFKNYLKTWTLLALTFLIKYQIHIFVSFFIAHILVSIRESHYKIKKFWIIFLSNKVFIGGFLALFIVVASHFYHFRNWERVLEINHYEAIKYSFGRNTLDLFVLSYLYHVGIGALISLSAICGIVLGFIKKELRLKSLILVSALPTFFFLYLYYTGGGFYTRNLLSAIPILLIFAALFVDYLFNILDRLVRNRFLLKIIFFVLTFILIFDQFKNATISAWEYSQISPRQKAQDWLDANIKGNIVFGRFMGNPIPHDEKIVLKDMLPYPQAFSYPELVEEGYDRAIIELTWIRAETLWWTRKAPQIEIKFWEKPNDLLSQGFYALAFRELLFSHGLGLFITPWQAVSHHFAVVDLKKEPVFSDLRKIMSVYDFAHGWTPLSYLNQDKSLLITTRDRIGATKLVIDRGDALPGGIRFQSDKTEVEGKRGYLVKAKIKIKGDIKKEERQALIRLDFYANEPKEDILSRPDETFVSKRVYGKDGTHEISIQAVAPEGVNFVVIGFQGSSVNASYTLESVEMFETRSEKSDVSPKIKIKDDDLFLPNDEGIL